MFTRVKMPQSQFLRLPHSLLSCCIPLDFAYQPMNTPKTHWGNVCTCALSCFPTSPHPELWKTDLYCIQITQIFCYNALIWIRQFYSLTNCMNCLRPWMENWGHREERDLQRVFPGRDLGAYLWPTCRGVKGWRSGSHHEMMMTISHHTHFMNITKEIYATNEHHSSNTTVNWTTLMH